MERIVQVKPLDNFKVWVKFADGFSADVDIKPFIKGGISDALKEKEFFKDVKVDDFNGISWKNGFDFCPNFLREYIKNFITYKNSSDELASSVADK
ncbi:MAG: DUF2442 domain-containing protein [Ignavibacteriae bacterium]|nr:DUF2442 domain-containing protein [Ignavibacteriota bacterium]